jgi:hypothetical protein
MSLNKKIKPSLIDNKIFTHYQKIKNPVPVKIIHLPPKEPSKIQVLITDVIHSVLSFFFRNFLYIILTILLLIYLWLHYKWYQNEKKKKNIVEIPYESLPIINTVSLKNNNKDDLDLGYQENKTQNNESVVQDEYLNRYIHNKLPFRSFESLNFKYSDRKSIDELLKEHNSFNDAFNRNSINPRLSNSLN